MEVLEDSSVRRVPMETVRWFFAWEIWSVAGPEDSSALARKYL